MIERDPSASLRRLVSEARAEKPQDIDFARIEERLLHEVRRSRPERSRPGRVFSWAALAVAASAALWLLQGRAPAPVSEPHRPALVAVSPALERDGDQLPLGARVSSAERSVTVNHAGRAKWRLEPNGNARLAERGERITVELEQGSVLSEVVPNPKPETFVIEAAGARVAVHGTVFRVSLEGGRVLVQVSEGVVAVGPRGGAPAFMLKAPAHGDFSADGLTGTVNGQPSARLEARPSDPVKPGRLRAVASAGSTPAAAAPSASAELPKEPSINDIESGIARTVDVASDCFRRHTRSAEGVEVTVRTALSLKITDEGAATNVEFQPPLSPDVELCAREGISKVTFTPSEQGAQVTRLLELKR